MILYGDMPHLLTSTIPTPGPPAGFSVQPNSWTKIGPTIGIAWRTETWDPRRSVPAHLAASLFEDVPFNVEVLQEILSTKEARHFPTARPRSLPVLVDVIRGLDLVIAVDSIVARAATALHRPTWLLKAADADWQSTSAEWASVVCPSLRIYQQSRPGDWDEVMRQIADDLCFCCQGDSFVLC